MRGIIFTALADMVEEQYGLDVWFELIDGCDLPSGGVYTAGGYYDDQEVFSLVGALCEHLDLPTEFVLRAFGVYLSKILLDDHRRYLKENKDLKSFLMAVNNVIHVDVEKLYPGTSVPFLSYVDRDENHLTLFYSSKRKLCFLAEGLIEGAADYYKTEIALIHAECMHRGDEYCRFEISFHGG